MTYAWRERCHTRKAFSVGWVIDAPWGHPIWSQYLVALYDLTTPDEEAGPVKFYLDGATHEFLVFALSPDYPVPRDAPISTTRFVPLHPANYGYQFKADSDDAALARVQEIVDSIVAKKLSPDTDFRSLWNKLLPDCFPMVSTGLGINELHLH